MVTPAATDWHGVALGKVTRVMGESAGRVVMTETLAAMGATELRSGDDLRTFARLLAARGGFAEAVAGLLNMHAAMYDPSGPT